MKKVYLFSLVILLAGLILGNGVQPATAAEKSKYGGMLNINHAKEAASFGYPLNIRHWDHEYTD
ncbi:MAG: hypothetical protein JRJ02_06315, partial [Deltaproteobacteria bacterium]|nr:hypothetical protein [Deltaproteobacteria bacterium]